MENGRLAWDVLTISCFSPALFFLEQKKWKKTKMDELPETSSQFRGWFRAQICEKNHKKTDQIFQERAFGLRRPHNFAISLAFFLFKKFEKRTFRLRRPHNFADGHGRRIDRYVSKTDVWLETSSQFRFQICPKMINSLYFFLWKTGVWLETSSQFRVLSGVFSFKTKIIKSKNGRLAWDVLIISLPVSRSNFWKKNKLSVFFWGKRAFGVRRPHNFVFSPALFFFSKKNEKRKWTICLRRPHNFAAGFALKFVKKIIRKRIRFFKNGRLGWDVLTISRSRLLFFCLKKLKNGRFAWDVLTILQTNTVVESIVTFQKRTFGLRRPHNFAFKFVKKW